VDLALTKAGPGHAVAPAPEAASSSLNTDGCHADGYKYSLYSADARPARQFYVS